MSAICPCELLKESDRICVINLCTSGKVLEVCSVRLYARSEIDVICYPESYMSKLKSAMILDRIN